MIPFSAPSFTIIGAFDARVVSLHDGDTFTCVFGYNGSYHKFSVRLEGIDTPEMTSKDPDHKQRALVARNRLFELITGVGAQRTLTWTKKTFEEYFNRNYTYIRLTVNGLDKYGRLLGSAGDPSFSSVLLKEGHAYAYDGGTKNTEF